MKHEVIREVVLTLTFDEFWLLQSAVSGFVKNCGEQVVPGYLEKVKALSRALLEIHTP